MPFSGGLKNLEERHEAVSGEGLIGSKLLTKLKMLHLTRETQMKKILKSFILLIVLFGLLPISYSMENITPMPPLSVPGQIPSAQEAISPEDAAKFIGETKTVCGTVASAHFAAKVKGQPTFINLDKPYPNQVFTVLIWGSDRGKFEKQPETLYSGKDICVTGMIQSYQGKPEIVVKEPGRINVK